MKYSIFLMSLLAGFYTSQAIANDRLAISDVEKIFWLNGPEQKDAIVYAQFENFNNIVSFIEQTAMPHNSVKVSSCRGGDKAEQLLLTANNTKDYVSLMDNCIQYGKQFYKADKKRLSEFRAINMARINNNELIGKRALKLAKRKLQSVTRSH